MKSVSISKHRSNSSKRKKGLHVDVLESRLMLTGTPQLLQLDDFDSFPKDFVEVDGVAYFVAESEDFGAELWRTDGTLFGTLQVLDINSGPDGSNPQFLTNVDGTLFFSAIDGENGRELWRSDGTEAGTVMVRDIFSGDDPATLAPGESSPGDLVNFNGSLVFAANDGVSGRELWTSDGTESGTVLLRDIAVGTDPVYGGPGSSNPTDLTPVDGTLFFAADDGNSGNELWKSDGTPGGTVLVRDIAEGADELEPYLPYGSNPNQLIDVDGKLFFVATDDRGLELWTSDGTENGTVLVRDIHVGTDQYGGYPSYPSNLTNVNGTLFFSAFEASLGDELWMSDGTEAGTTLVRNIGPGNQDGTYNTELVNLNGVLFFTAEDGDSGRELWRTDGTEAGTQRVADIFSGANSSFPTDLTVSNNKVFFAATSAGNGTELWESDGTTEGTVEVADLFPGDDDSQPEELFDLNGTLLFSADNGNSGFQLFTLDTSDAAATLTIFVNGTQVNVPNNIGVDDNGTLLSQIRTDQNGDLVVSAIGDEGITDNTLAEFFNTWRTNAGQAGNNANARFDATQLLGNQTDLQNSIQMFVNGTVSSEFERYEVRGGDDIILTFGSNPVVSLNSNFGPIVLELFEGDAPATVDNFLNYANDGDYNNTFFHRAPPGFVIQTGGFSTTSTTFTSTAQFSDIPSNAPVVNEFGRSNTRGTVAMAKLGGDPNSATNQFFVNLGDNSTNLDNQNGGFTVFAQVLDMTSSDAIADLPLRNEGGAYDSLPVSNDNQLAVIQSVTGVGTISGERFTDVDSDGFRDPDEDGIGLVFDIYLDANDNGLLDTGEITATPDSDGQFRFQVEPGTYIVRAEPIEDSVLTLPSGSDSYTVNVEIGRDTSGIDFANGALLPPDGIELASASDTGIANDDGITNLNNANADSTLDFIVQGTVAGAEIRIFSDGTLIGTGTANDTSTTVTTDGLSVLAEGTRTITATQIVGGVESDPSTAVSIEIDTVGPTSFSNSVSDAPEFPQIGIPFSFDLNSSDEGQSGIEYSLVSGPTGMTVNAATGLVEWTPTSDQVGPQTVEVRLADVAGNTIFDAAELTVLGVIPAFPNEYQVNEDETLTIDAANGVLSDDGGTSTATLTSSIVDQPSDGSVTLNADGSFVYTPAANFFGTDSFTYQATDGTDVSNVARATITINGVDDPTTGVADTYIVSEDTVLQVDATTGVLANDIDPDNDTLTAILGSSPSNGTLSLSGDGSFEYTPNADFSGDDSFTYTVNDGQTTTSPITVNITVNGVDDPPVTVADTYSVNEDAVLTVAAATGVLQNDSDPDSTDLTSVVDVAPTNGQLNLSTDGAFTYTPNANFFGTDSFTYLASDGTTPVIATATITVNGQPDPPTAVDDTFTSPNDGTVQNFDVLANDSSEPDGNQTLTITAVTQGTGGGTVAITNDTVDYTAPLQFVGSDTFTYTIQDSDGLTSTASATVSVIDAKNSRIAGAVFLDKNNNGQRDANEDGVPGAFVTLSGTDVFGDPVSLTVITRNDGTYAFENLSSGSYRIIEQQPEALVDGIESTPDSSATTTDNQIEIELSSGQTLVDNNFGELELRPAFYSIAWFFASSSAPQDTFREFVAIGEEQAGRVEAATAIRAGETTPPATENLAPVATNDAFEVIVNQVLNVSITDGVLANDSDPNNDAITASVESTTTNGNLVLASNGSFTYTPNNGFVGTDSFTYAVADVFGASATATATIQVTAEPNVFAVDEGAAEGTSVGTVDTSSAAGQTFAFQIDGENSNDDFKIRPDDHIEGNPAAPVVLVEYLSFQCGVCASFHPIIEELQDEFETDLVVVRRHFPLPTVFSNAVQASISAEAAARQGEFDGMGDLLFENQADWRDSTNPQTEFFNGYAQELGLDMTQFAQDIADPAILARINRDADIAADNGFVGTPTFLLNGEQISNPADTDAFEVVIQDELNLVNSTFLINRLTGELFVNDNSALNASTNPTVDLVVNATNAAGVTTPIDVEVNVVVANNAAPVALSDDYTTTEEVSLNIVAASGVLANDNDADGATLTATLITNTSNGTLTLNNDGSFNYEPAENFSGTDTFVYQASDGERTSSNTTVTITIAPLNDAPVAVADSYTLSGQSNLDVSAANGVLANDVDADNDPLTASLVTNATNGTVQLASDGSFIYTPDANFTGTDTFTYSVDDGDLSVSIPVTIIVTSTNQAPVALDDSYQTDAGVTLSVDAASGILANDTDADGNILTAISSTTPINGTLTLNDDGSFTYVPDANFTGTDSFNYIADDGDLISASATVTLTVNSANAAPLGVADSFTVDEDGLLTIAAASGVLLNDSDADGDSLTAVIVNNSSNGTTTLNQDGSFEYEPTTDFNGTDTFTYRASDGTLESDVVTVTITVTPVPDFVQRSTTLAAVQDNSLYESSEGSRSNGLGEFLFAGKTNQESNSLRRALVQFDLAAANIPTDANILNVELTMNVSKTPKESSDTFGTALHRVSTEWGEGSSSASGAEGTGATSETGDATWIHSSFETVNWATPGGDFESAASATTDITDVGSVVWSSAQMAQDVEDWLATPAENFGWILIGDETTAKSARRFDSRENATPANRPSLLVEYEIDDDQAEGESAEGEFNELAGVSAAIVAEATTLHHVKPTSTMVEIQPTSSTNYVEYELPNATKSIFDMQDNERTKVATRSNVVDQAFEDDANWFMA